VKAVFIAILFAIGVSQRNLRMSGRWLNKIRKNGTRETETSATTRH